MVICSSSKNPMHFLIVDYVMMSPVDKLTMVTIITIVTNVTNAPRSPKSLTIPMAPSHQNTNVTKSPSLLTLRSLKAPIPSGHQKHQDYQGHLLHQPHNVTNCTMPYCVIYNKIYCHEVWTLHQFLYYITLMVDCIVTSLT